MVLGGGGGGEDLIVLGRMRLYFWIMDFLEL